jgi:hypothetical protein
VTCQAPKDKTFRGLGGERCGQLAVFEDAPGTLYCQSCAKELVATRVAGRSILAMALGPMTESQAWARLTRLHT